MNSSFAVNQYGGNFLNTSFGMYPSMALNVPLSIYPTGAACILMKWKHSKNITLQTAMYDGAPLGVERNPNNIKWEMNLSKAAFSTGEVHYQYIKEDVVLGNYKIGGFYHNGTFDNLIDSSALTGNYGLYFTADQMILPKADNKTAGLGAFMQLGSAPGNQNLVSFYVSGGINYKGIIASRNEDNVGLALVHSSINRGLVTNYSDRFLPHRTLLELTYKTRFHNHFSIQPDLQYIINPGANPELKNAFLGSLRLALNY
jgi:porin